nr:hypothetical protein [Psychrobacter sp. PraFG1]UNK05504.1 hypothetical protein MN210_00795 [Psychrobacter sp. PraFG1]
MYQVAAELMGSEGSQLVANMLSGQITKNKKIGERQVELAKCEFYSCMLVLKNSCVAAVCRPITPCEKHR